ncbi:MAG TPA: SsrA-binding protein SmpB [Candidatus Latescibacteria bacterium]|nr:SsrA-binding protein SmpB [Candidatus Latescibacterota bacterium]
MIRNRRARHYFEILDTIEAGIALWGTEVKSIRSGKANLRDSFARIEGGEVFLYNLHISPYQQGNRYNHDPMRTRKLLLHRSQIKHLAGKVQEKGLTLVPLALYFKNGRVKVELALARGKRKYDRREDVIEREAQREMERALKRVAQGKNP